MAAFDISAILNALADQGYRPPGMTNTQPNPYGVPGGMSSIVDALTGQGAYPSGPTSGASAGAMAGFGGQMGGGALGATGALGNDPSQSWGYNSATGKYTPPGGSAMGLPRWGGAHGMTAINNPTVFKDPNAPVVAPHAPEPGRAPAQVWGGGFGLSDNSAWGNKGDAAQLSRSGVNGSLKDMTNQAGTMASRPNATLPGAGSAFGLGGKF